VNRKLWNYLSVLIFIPVFALLFQNCSGASSPVAFSKAPSQATSDTEGTGGQPYDGKIYVSLGDLCPDQTKIHARILMKSASSAELVRDKCRDITPITLGGNDFQIDPVNTEKLIYLSQTFSAENLVNLGSISSVLGFGYWLRQDFGTPADSTTSQTRSLLRIFENGIELGPAHSYHADIETLGQGRFSHWESTAITTALYLSTSDNTDPRTNGRKYTYVVAP
jgi:hypothetical protein